MSQDTDRQYTNRLIDETSPYLLQHAHNPVDWYPWSDEALERARREDKLILLSIGYSACHWCHVMERESFENEEIAALMNENFINIKVDREERPDLDEIYMAATLAMNRGQGGWPMTVFLTPDLEPVFAGTYFPPTDMYGRTGFPTVLRQVARAWREDRQGLRQRATEFTEALQRRQSPGPALSVGEAELRAALDAYKGEFDPQYGGFGRAPKFPPSVALSLLLRTHRRFGDAKALAMVRTTLEGMARGGIHDHVGGGFARYATDRRWLIPHFEKMLYDNALLSKAYLEGYQATGDEFFARIAAETLDYVLREMTASEGGFYSSTDAESEGEEGKFFVWTPEQIADVLEPEEARRFNAYYDISPGGNWEGVSIPNTPRPVTEVAKELGIDAEELERTIESAKPKVYRARERRVKPGLDDKLLTAWNGLMIGALAEGFRVLRDRRYLEAAERAAAFVLETLSRDDGRLLRTYRAGRAHLDAYLEDYAYLSEGLIDLYEAGGAPRWLREAERLLERVLADFRDPETGAWFHTSRHHEQLVMRYREGSDGATPAANAVAAHALARISFHLDRADLRHAAMRAIQAYGSMISRYPRGFAKSLCAVDFLLEGPVELALVGHPGSADLEALEREIARHYLPNRIQARLDPEGPEEARSLPLFRGKEPVDGKAALFVCRDFACQAPVTDPADAAEQLQTAAPAEGRTTIAIRVEGHATGEGTTRYARRFPDLHFNTLTGSNTTVSRIGFGGYRIHERSAAHRQALRRALLSGVNLIDTATNYLDGASERLVGNVLRELADAGELSRDEVTLVSKIGYVQGSNLQLAEQREREGSPYPEMVKYDEGLWHCIHPDFLDDQLQRSLDRLEVETLDICLLHNPEYYLADAARNGTPVQEARDEFYRRLGRAFEFLESQVEAGAIRSYGVSSNTAVAPPEDATATSLSRMVDAARSAGGPSHRFRSIQVPLNLLEPQAVFVRNTGPDGERTVLEAAKESGMAVLVNRPLNAYAGGALLRLADVTPEETRSDLQGQLARVADLEMTFQAELAPRLETAPDTPNPGDYFRMAERIRQLQANLTGLAHWSQIEAQINYAMGALATALDQAVEGELAERWAEWRDVYLSELEDLLSEVRRQAAEMSQARNATLAAAIDPHLPDPRRAESLSQKALWTVASTPGVDCVLNGMRAADYVDDSTAVLSWPPLDDPESVYRAAAEALERIGS